MNKETEQVIDYVLKKVRSEYQYDDFWNIPEDDFFRAVMQKSIEIINLQKKRGSVDAGFREIIKNHIERGDIDIINIALGDDFRRYANEYAAYHSGYYKATQDLIESIFRGHIQITKREEA